MQRVRAAVIFVSTWLLVFGWARAQTTGENHGGASTAPDIILSISSPSSTAHAVPNHMVVISIRNNTSHILVHSYPVQVGSVEVNVRDAAGRVPSETEFGCRKHMSTKCGANVKLGGPVSFATMVVMPGKTISFDYNFGREYRLENIPTILVDAVARDLVLVDAPPSVTDAPTVPRNQYLSNYEQYNYVKIAPVHSNAIIIETSH